MNQVEVVHSICPNVKALHLSPPTCNVRMSVCVNNVGTVQYSRCTHIPYHITVRVTLYVSYQEEKPRIFPQPPFLQCHVNLLSYSTSL